MKKVSVSKLLQVLALGFVGGVGKVVATAVVPYLLAQVVNWFLR
jgi:hypothetical protein